MNNTTHATNLFDKITKLKQRKNLGFLNNPFEILELGLQLQAAGCPQMYLFLGDKNNGLLTSPLKNSTFSIGVVAQY